MKYITYLTLFSAFLFLSCGKEKQEKVLTQRVIEKERETKLKTIKNDGELLEHSILIPLKKDSKKIIITLDPYSHQKALRYHEQTNHIKHTTRNNLSGIECDVDYLKYSGLDVSSHISDYVFRRVHKYIKINGEVKKYSKFLSYSVEGNLINIEIDNTHFKTSEVELINPTVSSIYPYLYDTSRCDHFATHTNYKNIKKYGGTSSNIKEKEFVSFIYQLHYTD